MSEKLSLGHTVLKANEVKGNPVVTLNFVNPDHRLTLPFPDGDWYLRNTAVPAVRDGETVLCTTLIPGLQEYYREVGLVSDGSHIVEVEPSLDKKGTLGYPFTDPLAGISGKVRLGSDGLGETSYLVPTYTNVQTESQAASIGLGSIDRVDSVVTNNKASLRRDADKYGIPMLDGSVVESDTELVDAVKKYGSLEHGVWLKFATGSGGDLVYRVKNVSERSLRNGIHAMRGSIARAFTQGEFAVSAQDFWPQGEFAPAELPLVIESDARNEGKVLMNGSNHFVTNKDGSVQILNQFEQLLTDEGEYLGSRTFSPEGDVKQKLEDATMRAAEYNMSENSFYGIQGIDWFLMEDKNGDTQVKVVELNSRPIVSTLPVIVSEKVGAPHWINTNVYTDTDVFDINDYIDIVGRDLAFGNSEHGIVIPQAFRTLVTRSEVRPSPNFKILIMGDTPEKCAEIVDRLKQRGIRFTPPTE